MGYVTVTVPSAFSSTTSYPSTTAQAIVADTDTSYSFTLSTSLPSAGVYGPFQIITRTSASGQIYDANYVFGCVAVSASVSSPSASSLTVSTVTLTSTTAIVGSSDGLYFTFTIPAGTNLWKHDIFEIIPDTRWTMPSTPTCASVDITSITNNIKGPKGDNSLPCAVAQSGGANGGYSTAKASSASATNSIYIYGLSQDVIITSSYQVKLQVSTFTLPSSAVSSSSFTWNLKIWRWGTTNLLANFAGSGPLTPVAGTITVNSWVPYNTNVQSTDIPNTTNAFYIFTKLSLQTAHPITTGSITITFNSNVDINTGKWWQDAYDGSGTGNKALCYLNSYAKDVTCTVSTSAQSATITFGSKSSGLAANTAISITLLTKISSGAKVSSVTSNDATSATNVIDQNTSGYSFTFSSSATSSLTSMTDFQFYAAEGTAWSGSTAGTIKYKDASLWAAGLQTGGDLVATQYLMWSATPSTTWAANYVLVVSLSFSGSGVQLTQPYIKSTALLLDATTASGSTSDISLSSSSGSTSTGPKSGSPGSITVTIASASVPASTYTYVFAYGDPSSTDTTVTALPFVTSNVATFYECWAKASPPSGTTAASEFSSYVYSVVPGSTTDSSLKYQLLCTDTSVGIPIYATFHALTLAFNFADSTNHYNLDISFTGSSIPANLGSGLDNGSNFPVVSATTGYTPSATITSNTVTINGLSSVSAGSSVNMWLPSGNTVNSAGSLTFYYLKDGADPSIKMVLYTNSVSNTLAAGSGNGLSSPSLSSPASASYTVGGSSATTAGLAMSSSTSIANYVGIGLAPGFTLPSSYTLTLGTTTLTPVYGYSSSSSTFTGGFVIGFIPASATISLTSTAMNLALSSLNAPLTTGASTDANTAANFVVYATGATGASCKAIGTISSIKVSAAKITSDTCSMDKLYTQGSDSVDSTLTLTFTTVNPIPANGSIKITLSSSFSAFSSASTSNQVSSCQGVGLSDYSADKPQKCGISSSTITLSQFAQIAAGVVTVKVMHVIPSSTTTTALTCFTAVNTYDSNGYLIDSVTTGLANSVTVAASSTAGTTNTNSFKSLAYPNVAGATADVYLTFSLSKPVPAYGLITITPGFVSSLALSSGDVSSACWTDIDYLSCQVSGTSIQIQLSNTLAVNTAMSVYLDMALVLPTSNSTSTGWTISSSWGGVSITADSTSASPATFQQIIGTAQSNAITLSSINQINSQTADETSSYTFTFTSAVVVATTDVFVIEFPKDFSPLLGLASAVFPDCSPKNYYTTCSSSVLGISSGTYCSVDHWKLTVTGISKATTATTTSIDITVDGIQNPVATTTGKFNLYQYGSDGSVKAYVQKTGSVTPTAIPSTMVYLKDATVDVLTLSKSATYTFDFYLSTSTTFTTDHIISIYFPSQFNNKLRNGSTVPCKAVYYDESSSSTSTTTSNTLSSATSCSISGSNVTLPFPSSMTAATATTSRIQLQLTGFYNPESAISRTAGWDVTDYSTFSGSTKYDSFSNKFSIAINQNSKTQIYAESWPNLNSAYIGYSVGYGNSYSTSPSQTVSKIGLMPGQQSTDISVSILDTNNWPMKSKSYKLSPTTNANYPDSGNLKYTSAFYGFTVYNMVPQFTFRVAASSSATTGIYYIDWGTPTEKLWDGVQNTLYVAPTSMLIEVCSSLSTVTPTVDTMPTLYQYYTSIPIKVSLTNAPATQLIVTPTFSVAGFTATPTSLTFGPDVNTLYFQVYVGSTYVASTSTQPSISFGLSGTDVAAFTAPSKQTVTVSTTYPASVTATPGLSITKVSASEVKVSVTTTIAGVLYWGVGCQGSPVLTFSGLSALVSDLVSPSKSIQTLQEQLASQYQNTETDIDTTKGDTDINSFFKRIHSEHCSDYWASSQVISTAGGSVDLNWLMAGTSYTFSAYIATKLTNNTASYPLSTYNFTTDAAAQYYTTSVTFSGSVASSSSSSIAKVLAKNMGINPSWLTFVSTSRRLQTSSGTSTTTTLTYNVLSDSRYPAYTSSGAISNLNTNSAQATSDFSTQLALTSTAMGTSAAIQTGTAPSWSSAPSKTGMTDTSATFTATSSQAGTIYATCSSNDLTGHITYAWQVTNGLDSTTEKVPSANVASVASTAETLTVSGLTAGTPYVCYFTACNSYPVTPTCIDYTSTTPLSSISFTTSGSSGTDSSAVMIGASAALAFILTLLN
mmetsp:Transcript_15879/g.15835  ORF Transcript_15879/g.15835 Transcript_15879/m.15835 type:complete len:2183 (-) Transcript_15879:22-6570(-)